MIFIIYQMGTPDYSICHCSASAGACRPPGAPPGAEHTVLEPDGRTPGARELCRQQLQQVPAAAEERRAFWRKSS